MSALLQVSTTVATRADALRLARQMVQAQLAACVQIEAIHSVYRWQGELHEEDEWRLLLKTTAASWPALQAALTQAHPYELPAILAVPVQAASDACEQWVVAECTR